MAEQFFIAQGMLAPAIEVLCEDNNGRYPLVSASSPLFQLWGPDGSKVVNNGVAVITDPGLGLVRYVWTAGQTDIAGFHRARFQFTIAGKTIAFPSHGYIQVNVS